MKSTTVPAQITTVEDKIAGKLGMTQLLLLTIPLFCGGVFFVILPPAFHSSTYKYFLAIVLLIFGGILAIRIKGRLIISWTAILVRYFIRPQFYVFDKNDPHRRELNITASRNAQDQLNTFETVITHHVKQEESVSTSDLVFLQSMIDRADSIITFKTNKKGGLSVSIQKVV
jgi:hypothetical protein